MTDRNLHELLAPWIKNAPKCFLREMTLDSRTVEEGDLFIAIAGHKTDGRRYIYQAIKNKAAAIIAQAENKEEDCKIVYLHSVPIIYLNYLNKYLSTLSGRFYQNPSRNMHIIGVTGTNGKTCTTHILAQWVQLLGITSAVMGTIGNGIIGNIHPSENTTCSPIKVQKILSQLQHQNVKFTAMEVSSHGLVENRISNVYFAAAIFTNLTRDHLDYHGDMIRYEAAKWQLFDELDVGQRIINIDDDTGQKWIKMLPKAISVSVKKKLQPKNQNQWMYAAKVRYHSHGTEIYFCSFWGNGTISSPFWGEMNVSNLLLSLATLLALGYTLPELINTAVHLKPICGRMEMFHVNGFPKVIVDYAHTPDALKKTLNTIRLHRQGKIWCVFGCGGDRDKGKRELMGSISERYADQVIITDDNPRSEASHAIINDIKSGVLNMSRIQIIPSRVDAIASAIKQAAKNDLVLVTGKGHESYQIIKNKHLKCSDRVTVTRILGIKE